MNDKSIPASNLIYSFMTKYNILGKLIQENYGTSSEDKINLFIDLYSIWNKLYKSKNITFDNSFTIEGAIFAICTHYRQFFRSNYGVTTYIYLIDSNNTPSVNDMIYKGYNRSYKECILNNKILSDRIDHCRNVLNEVTPFINDIMYIGTDQESGVVIKDIINYNKNNIYLNTCKLNLIITKDPYLYQLIDDNTNVLRPYKYNGQDNSYIINRYNMMPLLLNECGFGELGLIPYRALSTIYTFTKLPDRNIKSIINMPIFVRQLLNLMHREFLVYNGELVVDIVQIYKILYNQQNSLVKSIPLDIIESRFKVIDIDYQYMVYKNSVTGKIHSFKGMYNFFGNGGMLDELCGKYFTTDEANLIVNYLSR